MVRYMRLRVVASEASIAARLTGEEQESHYSSFRSTVSTQRCKLKNVDSLKEIVARYPRLSQDPSPPKENATMDDVRTGLARLTDLQEVEMLDRKIASLPTWPFDIQVVSRFITIVLSVTAVLLSRLITNFLHI